MDSESQDREYSQPPLKTLRLLLLLLWCLILTGNSGGGEAPSVEPPKSGMCINGSVGVSGFNGTWDAGANSCSGAPTDC